MTAVESLVAPDYADNVAVRVGEAIDASPEEWARAALERTPTGRSAPRLWRLLGLRLGPRPSPDHVQGWRIADRGDGWIRLETASWFLTAQAVLRVAPPEVSLALSIRYDHPIAKVIWPPVSVFHRRVAPTMIRQAVRTLESS